MSYRFCKPYYFIWIARTLNYILATSKGNKSGDIFPTCLLITGKLLYFKKKLDIFYHTIIFFSSPEHLLWSIIAQIAVGLPLEMVHGPRVLIIYCAGILGGSVIQSGIYPLEDLAGGSPGGHAIIIAHISKIVLVSICLTKTYFVTLQFTIERERMNNSLNF